MWHNQITQDNLEILRQKSFNILGPEAGSQACGEIGIGRMLNPREIVALVSNIFCELLLKNKKVLITAGPTIEPIDPVRYIANRSSGKMGYAIATAAKALGATVKLISGPTQLSTPIGITRFDITTAKEMYKAVMQEINVCGIFIAVAAVSDYRVATPKKTKN